MANKQKYRLGRFLAGPPPVNEERRATKELSGRQRVKLRKAARRNAQRAKGLAQVLEVQHQVDTFVDPAAKLIVPPGPRVVIGRRPPSPRPG
jgi:hypothetical protein